MFMHPYTYHRPTSLPEALKLASELPDPKFLAGGQTLVQAMKLRLAAPSDLIDLGGLAELRGIDIRNDEISIGAMTKHAAVCGHAEIKKRIGALAYLASQIGDRQIRNNGTIGGSLANSDPAADYPAAALGLGATLRTNDREITADDFFVSLYETALEPNELLVSIRFPIPKRAGYMKFKSPASGFALVGVFVADFGDHVRVAVTGAGPKVFRIAEMEQALRASFSPDVLNIHVSADGLSSDLQANAQYRAHLIPVLARRAVEAALA